MPPLARRGDQQICPSPSLATRRDAKTPPPPKSKPAYVEHRSLVRVGDKSNHHGVIFTGSPTVSIDD